MQITVHNPEVAAELKKLEEALARVAVALEEIAKNTAPEKPTDVEIKVEAKP